MTAFRRPMATAQQRTKQMTYPMREARLQFCRDVEAAIAAVLAAGLDPHLIVGDLEGLATQLKRRAHQNAVEATATQ